MDKPVEPKFRDILKNLSCFRGFCRNCGRHGVEFCAAYRRDGWLICKCGHIFHARNVWSWH